MRVSLRQNPIGQRLLCSIKNILNSMSYRCDLISPEDLVDISITMDLPDTVMRAYRIYRPRSKHTGQKEFLLCYRTWVDALQLSLGQWHWFFLQDTMSGERIFIKDGPTVREAIEQLSQ